MNQRAEQKQATRKHLYDIAMALFERHGYPAINIDEIVRRSRVARGTFYFHFPTKEDVLLEAIREGERAIVARLDALDPATPLRAVLGEACAGFEAAWGGRRELLPHACVVALRRIAAVAGERDEDLLRRGLVGHVERALASGALSSLLPAQMLADIFLLDVFAALMAWGGAGQPPLGQVMPGVIDLFLRGAEGVGRPLVEQTATPPRGRARKPARRPRRSPTS
ncbi:MAG: TetR/AcrR family transcriptional regulator [Deltaproteobacteria bacterium]|nr:TetR/AcrR family transcriptional regulator [Deltaproteobacteria bacterium]